MMTVAILHTVLQNDLKMVQVLQPWGYTKIDANLMIAEIITLSAIVTVAFILLKGE